jgi:hypothetical protein
MSAASKAQAGRGLPVGTWLWLSRREFAAVVVLTGLGCAGYRVGALPGAIAFPVVAVAGAVACPRARRRLSELFASSRQTRLLASGLAQLAPASWRGGLPEVRRMVRSPAGWTAELLLPSGAALEDLVGLADRLAVTLRLASVTVAGEASAAARVRLQLRHRDPLANVSPPWPWACDGARDLWEAVPLGLGEDGEPVVVPLVEHNLLVGGEPGAGKSVALSLLVAGAGLDPAVDLHLFDGKLVELAAFSPLAVTSVGTDTALAVDVLGRLVADMDTRYEALLEAGARKISPELGWRVQVVVVDELAYYLATGSRETRAQFTELLRDLVSRGRAAGMVVLAATQKPGSEVVSTSLRDLFGFRLALRCSTNAASDTILGAGWASSGYNAATIDAATRGVGYLLTEGARPRRIRCYHLSDDDIAGLVAAAGTIRDRAQAVGASMERLRMPGDGGPR